MSRQTHLAAPFHKGIALLTLALSFLMLCVSDVYAQDTAGTFPKAIKALDLNSFGDARLRYHTVNQDAFADSAEALSLSVRLGAELNIFETSTLLFELEGSENFIENFDDTLNGQITRPVISDPDSIEINRLQFQTEIIPKTRLTVGRQLIALDDWRFIGHWPFRQNEQTFDAIRVETEIGPKPLKGLLNAAYTRRVQRQFGNDSPVGEFDGDSIILNYSLPTPLGRLAAFYYGLDLETGEASNRASNFSSATTGLRINGRHKWKDWGLIWDGSIAQQTDFADNPNNFNALYAKANVDLEIANFAFGLSGELLGSDNGQAVQTPLGALHRLQGAADIFTITPDDGLRDYTLSTVYRLRRFAFFEDVQAKAEYHWFESDADRRAYGQEIDFEISGKWKNIRFGAEYADYEANGFGSDTQVFILSTTYDFD